MKKITLLLMAFALFSWMGVSAQNLIEGGDFDRENWQKPGTPDHWTFDKLQVKLVESASYPDNKGWMYVDVTPAADGKMRLYVDDMNMRPDYKCMEVAAPAKYAISFWAKSEAGCTLKVSMPWYGADGATTAWTSPEIKVNGAEWKQYTVFTDVAPEGTKGAGLEVLFEAEGGVVSFDDFSVAADKENHAAGEILIDGKKPGETPVVKNDYTANLIESGDFDRENWQKPGTPDHWTFDKLQVKLVESASYPDNKGWMYVDVTPAADGKMRLYVDDTNMLPDYKCMEVAAPAKYAVMFWAKSEGAATFKINMPWYGADGKSVAAWTSPEIKVEGTTWKKYLVFTDVAPEGTERAGLEVLFEAEGGVVSFDDFGVYADKENHKAGEIVVEGDQEPEPEPNPDQPTAGNLFEFGDFEKMNEYNNKNFAGWYITNTALFKVSNDVPAESTGKQSLCIYPGSTYKIMTNNMGKENILKVVEHTTYTLSFWAKGNNADDKFSARFQWFGNDEEVGEPTYVVEDAGFSPDWKLHTYEVQVPWDVNSAAFVISFSTDNDYVFFDDFKLVAKAEGTGIASLNEGKALISVNNGQVSISVKQPVSMEIYSITGKLVRAEQLSATSTFALQKGAYIIKLGDKTQKVLVK